MSLDGHIWAHLGSSRQYRCTFDPRHQTPPILIVIAMRHRICVAHAAVARICMALRRYQHGSGRSLGHYVT